MGEELFGLQLLTAGVNYLFSWKGWTASLFAFEDTLLPKETALKNNNKNDRSLVLLTALYMKGSKYDGETLCADVPGLCSSSPSAESNSSS